MSRTDEQRRRDILDACEKRAEIAAQGRAAFERSWRDQSAAERQLEIVGEAISRLSDEFTEAYPDLPIREAKDLRNVLAHGYFRVDLDMVWGVIVNRVPELLSALSDRAS